MDDNTAFALAEDFARALSLQDTHDDRGSHGMIVHALRSLPQPQNLIFHSSDGFDAPPIALLLAGDRLIEVRVGRDGDGNDGPTRVGAISHALRDSGARIELEWGDRQTTENGVNYGTTWRFKFADGETIRIVGRVTTMPEEFAGIDNGEEFARAVADRLGQQPG